MTSLAMLAGMSPLALGWGEGGEQSASLGRAVMGGLAAATLATLFVLPSVFAIVQGGTSRRSASLDPLDPESDRFVAGATDEFGGEDLDSRRLDRNGHDEIPAGPRFRGEDDQDEVS